MRSDTPPLMRQESGPIFVRSELPQPSSAHPFRLRPIATVPKTDPAARLRQITPARLALQVEESAGSGLIDLDEVARALVQEPGEPAVAVRERLVATSPTPLLAADPARPHATASRPRGLLVATVVLLTVLTALLAVLAAG